MSKSEYNILFVTHYGEMYGANQSLLRLMIELRDDYGVIPHVLIASEGPICSVLNKHNITYTVSHFYWWVHNKKGVFQKILNLKKQFQNLIKAKKIVALFSHGQFDLIYSNSITINMGALLSKQLKLPHLWHIRESLQALDFSFSWGTFISRQFLKTAAAWYLVISDFLLDFYKKYIPEEKLLRIYNGIDTNSTQKRKNWQYDTIHICSIGVLSEQKNQIEQLQALLQLIKSYPNLSLHLIGGEDAYYKEKLVRFVSAHNLQDYVVFHGHIDDIDSLLNEMHVGLMSSKEEGFGRAAVEMMLHGVPVIAANSGGIPEVIRNGVNGFLYELNRVDELVSKMEYFLEQPERMQQMGESACQFAKENFSSKLNTKMIFDEISRILS